MPSDFETKDSGERAVFDSGMQRDTQAGKPRFDLCLPEGIPYEEQLLTRFAKLMGRGAEKYTERNWEQANSLAEIARMRASGLRHFMQWYHGETDEDHAAAVLFNIMATEATAYKLELELRAAELDCDPDCDVPIDGEQLLRAEDGWQDVGYTTLDRFLERLYVNAYQPQVPASFGTHDSPGVIDFAVRPAHQHLDLTPYLEQIDADVEDLAKLTEPVSISIVWDGVSRETIELLTGNRARFVAGFDGTEDRDADNYVVAWVEDYDAEHQPSLAQMINDRLYNFQG